MKTITVNLKFEGSLIVKVPKDLSPEAARKLAENKALCFALATTENPDAPELEAFEETEEETGITERQWDKTIVDGISGTWSLVDEENED